MTKVTTMKQVQMQAYGGAEVLHLVEVDVPRPGAGQLLVQVEAAGVNFSDVLRRRNTYFMPTPLPYVLGAEAVGVVAEVGEGVTNWTVGDRILAILPYGGGYSAYLTLDAQYGVPLPPVIAAADATALFVQGSTAHLLVHQQAPNLSGKTVLVHAAAGGVGSLLVQLARLAGAGKVIGTASTAAKRDAILTLGADVAVDYTQPDWPAQVRAANGEEGVDVIFEMTGGEVYRQNFGCLRTGGTMLVYGSVSGQPGLAPSELLVDEGLTVQGFNLAHFIASRPADWQASLGAVIGLAAAGQLRVLTHRSYPLEEVARAHHDLETRRTEGKVWLAFA